jgi:hypothetical protein
MRGKEFTQERWAVFEWLRKKGLAGDAEHEEGEHDASGHPLYRIEFEKMIKGSLVMRRGKPIRQCGVTIDGSTRLVTSGDMVDRETYEALVSRGIIQGTLERPRRSGPTVDPNAEQRKPKAEAS